MRRTKIVATIGPATADAAVLDSLVAMGLDVARLNASHNEEDELAAALAAVRAASERSGKLLGVMVDLPGPKIRIGAVAEGSFLTSGAAFDLVPGDCMGDSEHACVTWRGMWRDLSPGDRVLVDDGRIVLETLRADETAVHTRVVEGGPLKSRKGVNVPGVRLSVPSITERDLRLAAWARDAGVEFVAQSFVRSPSDVARVREVLGPDGPALVAKIEKHEAVAALDAIIAAADAVMVARGDLGVEMPVEAVPVLQRQIVACARSSRKPVIVATQMLESMIHEPAPTRAEASDVATAIFEGADAVMLSAETAVGDHPVEAVAMMARIAQAAEAAFESPPRTSSARSRNVAAAVSAAVVTLAENLDVAAIVTATRSGSTARAVAGLRPHVPVVGVTTEIETARRLTLVWGVTPVLVPPQPTVDETFAGAVSATCDAGLAKSGDLVALTAGVAVNVSGTTDLIRVITA